MKIFLLILFALTAQADINQIWEIDTDYDLYDIKFDSNYEKAFVSLESSTTFIVIDLILGDTLNLIHYGADPDISNFSKNDSLIAISSSGIRIIDSYSSTVSNTFSHYLYRSPDEYVAFIDHLGFSKDTSFIYIEGSVRIHWDNHQGSENNEYNIITLYDYENTTIIDSLRFHIEHEIKEWDCEIKQIEFIPNTDILFVYFTSREKEFNNVILWDYVQDSLVFDQQLEYYRDLKFILNDGGDIFHIGTGHYLLKWDFSTQNDIYQGGVEATYGSDFSVSKDEELLIIEDNSFESTEIKYKSFLFDYNSYELLDSLDEYGDYYFVGDDKFIIYHEGKLKLFEYTPPTIINYDNGYDQVFYPNPSSGELNIELKGKSLYKYSIYNINGEEVETGSINSSETDKLNIYIKEAGVYFISLDNGKKVRTLKVVIE